jgi:hypothetical protein
MNRIRLQKLCVLTGVVALVIALVIAAATVHQLPAKADWPKPQPITCVNNLKQIGLAFKTWALDHQDHFPFNLSTNDGGTMEYCARNSDGFDSNVALHFQVMSNELSTPLILLCPRDHTTKPARDFSVLRAENVTYWMRSGTNVTDADPQGQLVKCPIDGNILHCDGTVTEAAAEPATARPAILDLLEFNTKFRRGAIEAASAGILGCALLFCGNRLRSEKSPGQPTSHLHP